MTSRDRDKGFTDPALRGDPRTDSRGETDADPTDGATPEDARFARAWRVWLAALAHDSEAAYAAGLTYRSLDVAGRNAWIDALEVDAPDVAAPAIALYAPLLGVEEDPVRRVRIENALLRHGSRNGPAAPTHSLRGLWGQSGNRRIAVLVQPLYLDFVQVLTCEISPDGGFAGVHCDPLRRAEQAPVEGHVVDGIELERVPIEPIIEELSHAVLAQRRHKRELPPSLKHFVDLFTPRPEVVDTASLKPRS